MGGDRVDGRGPLLGSPTSCDPCWWPGEGEVAGGREEGVGEQKERELCMGGGGGRGRRRISWWATRGVAGGWRTIGWCSPANGGNFGGWATAGRGAVGEGGRRGRECCGKEGGSNIFCFVHSCS